METLLTLAVIASLGIIVLYLLAIHQIIRKRTSKTTVAMLVMRLVIFIIALLLVGAIYFRLILKDAELDDPLKKPVRIALLQDQSMSMDFQANRNVKRGQLAEQVVRQLKETLQEQNQQGRDLECETLLFAANVVPPERESLLEPRATQLNSALTYALSQVPFDRLVVVSDGAATDGSVPPFILDWLGNRRTERFAICAADPAVRLPDFAFEEVEYAKVNPARLVATVRLPEGVGSDGIKLWLYVDGQQVESASLPENSNTLRFDLPELEVGWHAFKISIVAQGQELTTLNNHAAGAFRVTPADKILILYGGPGIENVHLVRTLRPDYESRMTVQSIYHPDISKLVMQDYALVVVSDLAWNKLPPEIRQAIRDQQVACLLLAGDHTADWAASGIPGYPITQTLGAVDLLKRFGTSGTPVLKSTQGPADLSTSALSALNVNALQFTNIPPSAHIICEAAFGRQSQPLLITDNPVSPGITVLLTNMTWKWAVSSDAESRQQYTLFWNAIMAWLMNDDAQKAPLRLEFTPHEQDPGLTLVTISTRTLAQRPDLSSISLTIQEEQQELQVKSDRLRLVPDGFEYAYRHPENLPAVIWFQAVGSLQNAPVRSERRPLILGNNLPEWQATAVNEEPLRLLVKDPDLQFAYAGEAANIIQQIVAPPPPGEPPPPEPERDHRLETILASLLALLFATEWFLERWLKGRQK